MGRATDWPREAHDLPHEEVRTTHGRVVYGRKKREFTAKDLHRIASALRLPIDPRQMVYYLGTIVLLIDKAVLLDPLEDEDMQERIARTIAEEMRKQGLDPEDYGYEEKPPDPYADLPSGRKWWQFWLPPFPTDL